MGTDIESIQQTYQSLMRGNYAMLDNLKLGYGGTKSELERLVSDAEKLTGQALDPAKFSDVITAIHAVQDNLGITGTTAKEAATTIEGSIGMMKAAWDNLLVGIANENGDLGSLIYEFAHTVETAASNILPRVEIILGGISQLIADMGPIIAQALPDMISAVLPSLISAGSQLLVGLITGIVSAAPQLVAAVPGIISGFVNALAENGPTLLASGQQLLSMVSSGIVEGFPVILEDGTILLTNLIDGIMSALPDLIARLPEIITGIANFISENLPNIVNSGIQILQSLITGIINAIPSLVSALPQIINAIVNGIKSLMGSIVGIGKNIVQGIWQGIQNMASWIKNKVKNFFGGIVDSVKGLLGIHSPSTVFADMGRNMALGMGEGWDSEFSKIKGQIEGEMNFQTGSVDFASSALGRSQTGLAGAINSVAATMGQNFTITVQSVLDGRVIGETAYQYSRNKARAYGG